MTQRTFKVDAFRGLSLFIIIKFHHPCCFRLDPSVLRVRLGEWDTTTGQDHPYLDHEDHYVAQVIIHENFNPRNVYNDVALLILDSPANLNHHINTICLPQPGQNFDGQFCSATGWGKDHFGKFIVTNLSYLVDFMIVLCF